MSGGVISHAVTTPTTAAKRTSPTPRKTARATMLAPSNLEHRRHVEQAHRHRRQRHRRGEAGDDERRADDEHQRAEPRCRRRRWRAPARPPAAPAPRGARRPPARRAPTPPRRRRTRARTRTGTACSAIWCAAICVSDSDEIIAVRIANAPTSSTNCSAVGRPMRTSARTCARVGRARASRARAPHQQPQDAPPRRLRDHRRQRPRRRRPSRARTRTSTHSAMLTTLAAIDASIGERASPSP